MNEIKFYNTSTIGYSISPVIQLLSAFIHLKEKWLRFEVASLTQDADENSREKLKVAQRPRKEGLNEKLGILNLF